MLLDRFSLTDKVAVVTGAGRGIGAACALGFAEAGADLATAYTLTSPGEAVGLVRSARAVGLPVAISFTLETDGRLPELSEDAQDAVLMRGSSGSELAVRQASALQALGPVDVAIALLHGPFGEDGTIQGLFEMMGTRYVGAGVLASAVSMDKAYMKIVLQAAGLPVLPSVTITAREWAADPQACRERADALGYPLFVKPARGGSSIGISKAHDSSELDECLAEGLTESPLMPLQDTLDVQWVMQEALDQLGVPTAEGTVDLTTG